MPGSPNIARTQNTQPADGETLLWACDQRDPRTLSGGLLNDARNLRYRDGLPETRRGVVKPTWANKASGGKTLPTGTPYGAAVFRDPNGAEWQLKAAGGGVWRTRPHNAEASIPLPAGVQIRSAVTFVQAFGLVFLFRGQYLAPLVMGTFTDGFEDLLPHYDPAKTYNATIISTGQAADEIAYGPFQAVTSITVSGSTATVAVPVPHGYVTGADITIRGADQIEFNGRFNITVLDDVTFTFDLFNATVTSPTGTITCSNMIQYWRAGGRQTTLTTLARQVVNAFTITALTSRAQFSISAITSARSFTVASVSRTGTTATAIAPAHGLATGETITLSSTVSSGYSGTHVITVTSPDIFTFTVPSGFSTPMKGVITCSAPESLLAVATANNHGLNNGDTVTISGASPSNYNGTFAVAKLSSSSFSYTMASTPSSSASGTIVGLPAVSTTAIATKAAHGLLTGDVVTVAGATPSAYNVTAVVVTKIDNNTFSYPFAGGSATVTGTITVTKSSGTTALATKVDHGFLTGDYVTISGAHELPYNGTFEISVLSASQFTYVLPSDPGGDATGILVARSSLVTTNQSPEENPDAWQRIYNILPNADTALFINDLLLVPTAFEPASVDNYATFSGGSYKKKDYLVATNYLDYLHFSFANEFRINAGDADEIVDLFQFGAGTVIVLKGKSFGILANVSLDLTAITLDMRQGYGCVGRGAWTVAGSNAYFLSSNFGIVVIRQTDLGQLLGVNVPLSTPVEKSIQQIDWPNAAATRMAHWDNKLYMAAPMTDGTPTIFVFDFFASVRLGNSVWETGVMVQGWTPLDTGSALTVFEFYKLTLNGEERLFYLDTAGYVNLVEESDCGDQIANATSDDGLAWKQIESYALSRAYDPSLSGQQRPVEECLSLMTFDPCYTARIIFAGVGLSTTLMSNKTRDNTRYAKPFDAAPWDRSNVNDDWAKPYREDYAVSLKSANLVPAGSYYDAAGMFVMPALATGQTYTFTPGTNEGMFYNGTELPLEIINGVLVPLANGAVLKMWDAGKGAWQYLTSPNGQCQITDYEDAPNGLVIPTPDAAVLKEWDAGKSAWQYLRIANGQYQITDS